MIKIKKLLLSRKTVLSLILLILGTIILSYLFPQRFLTSPDELKKWHDLHPFWAQWHKMLGLDHVFTTPWFAALLFLFLVALLIATYEQIKISIKKTFGQGIPSGEKSSKLSVPEGELISAIKKQGYFKIAGNQTWFRFVKHPWGYWGNVLLHLGIVITIASSLLIVLTQKRGLLHLVEGEVHIPGSQWYDESKGILAGNFILPEAVRVDNVISEFWETDDLKQLRTTLSFIDPQGRFTQHALAINSPVNYKGIRIYQTQDFGDAFFVEFNDKDGRRIGKILQMQNPLQKDKPSYRNFQLEEMPYLLKAKYFADAEKNSMNSTNPLLVLRLVDDEKVVSELPLKNGESGQLGPYMVQLAGVSKWSGFIFVDITGMPGIFFGFFIIILGSGLTYFMPPREFYVKKEDSEISLMWKASRFESLYREEHEKVLSELGHEKS